MNILLNGKATKTNVSPIGLSQLLAPFDPSIFERDYYEREPLVLHRADPNYYSSLLTLDDLDHTLSVSNLRVDNIRVVVDGAETPITELCASCGKNGKDHELELLYGRYRDGSTVVLNSLERRSEPLMNLCNSLAAETDLLAWINLYLTPVGARGFKPHYDTHDVFILQVHGSKHWRLYGSGHELPLRSQPHKKTGEDQGPPVREFDLQAGDLLYLPRGYLHDATSNESASAHLTVGVEPFLWSVVIQEAVHSVLEEDVSFRRGFPLGFALDPDLRQEAEETAGVLLDRLRSRLSGRELVSKSVESALDRRRVSLRHHLTDLELIGTISLDTCVRRRPELRGRISVEGDSVSLAFHGKTVQLPAAIADELRFVAEDHGGEFTPATIPGDLDEPGRILLVQTLTREGFLTLSPVPVPVPVPAVRES